MKESTTLEEIRSKGTKTVTNPETGNTFVIGRILVEALWAEGILISDAGGEGVTVDPELLKLPFPPLPVEQRQRALALTRAAVIRGVKSLRIVDVNPGDGEIALSELDRRDIRFLSDEILIHSGVMGSVPASAEASADPSFPDGEGAGGASS